MFDKMWSALTKPILPPAKADELKKKTDDLGSRVKNAIERGTNAAKEAMQGSPAQQSQIVGPGSTSIQAGGNVVFNVGETILGTGPYVYRCRGYACRSEKQVVTAREIMQLQVGDSGRIGESDFLYYMADDGIMVGYRREQQVDLTNLPTDMDDEAYGFGIRTRVQNDHGDQDYVDL